MNKFIKFFSLAILSFSASQGVFADYELDSIADWTSNSPNGVPSEAVKQQPTGSFYSDQNMQNSDQNMQNMDNSSKEGQEAAHPFIGINREEFEQFLKERGIQPQEFIKMVRERERERQETGEGARTWRSTQPGESSSKETTTYGGNPMMTQFERGESY
jgi:hypothetical protein